MAFYSLVIYAGNGSNRNFTIHFPYLDKSHVKAKIDSSKTTAFSWLTDSSIQFNTAPAAGANIEIYRETPLNASPVDFTDGSILLERDLDLLTTFNLYVDQEITDRASRALSAGNQTENSAGNQAETQGSDYGTTGGSGSDMSGYATLKANTFDGVQTMTGLKVKNTAKSGNSIMTLQGTSDWEWSAQCGVQYTDTSGTIKYQHYYTPENIAWHVLSDAVSNGSGYRWCFEYPVDIATAASLKRNRSDALKDPNYYSFNVGDPYNQAFGAALNTYGVAPRWPKLSMYISNIFRAGLLATNEELRYTATTTHTLDNVSGQTYFTINNSQAMLFYSTNRNNRMEWMPDGNIALVRNNAVVWTVNGSITSDVRLKTDIKPLEGSSLEKVKQLNAKTYLWKDDLMGKGDKREIGLIAQEVAAVVPEVVSKLSSGADTLGVAYTQLVPVLVEAVKELSAKVEALEAQLETKK